MLSETSHTQLERICNGSSLGAQEFESGAVNDAPAYHSNR